MKTKKSKLVRRKRGNPKKKGNINSLNKRLKKMRSILSNIKDITCENFNSILYYSNKKGVIRNGLKLLGSGSSGISYSTCLDKDCKNNLVFKFIKISKDYDYLNIKHPVNVEKTFIKYLSDKLLKTKICPHLILYYGDFDCKADKIFSIKEFNQYDKDSWEKDISENLIYEQIKTLLIEETNTDLFKLLESENVTKKELLILLFQLFYTMVTVQYYLPNFRHNDLKTNNILISRFPKIEGSYYKYTIFGMDFYIPNIGIRLKLWDFDFSVCDTIKNLKIEDEWTSNFGATEDTNPIYDIHTFMNMSLNSIKNADIKEIFNNNLTTKDPKIVSNATKVSNESVKLIGNDTEFTLFGRLTGNKKSTLPANIIPNDIYSFGDYLIDDNSIFNYLKIKPKKGKLIGKYNSKIEISNIKKRRDIFNVHKE